MINDDFETFTSGIQGKNADFNHSKTQGCRSWYMYRNCMSAGLRKTKDLFGDRGRHNFRSRDLKLGVLAHQ